MISSGSTGAGAGGGEGGGSSSGPAGSGSAGQSNGGGLLKKGPWTAAEDEVLIHYVRNHGEGNWNAVQKHSGLNRCGKSCRLRWANHLRPNLKKGSFTQDEERLILELHAKYGNKWARMASHLPGRTDNEIKNYWNTRVKRRKRQGLPLYPNDIHQHQQQQQLSSPTAITTTTPTPPTTPTNFPFQSPQIPFQSNNACFDPTLPFSFQYRPVPLLAAPLACFKPPPAAAYAPQASPSSPFVQFSATGGFDSCAVASPGAMAVKTELPSSQFHQNVVQTPENQRIHSGAGSLEDILDNLLDEAHISIEGSSEFLPKEEAKEHINSLPEDLSKLLNFAPPSAAATTLQLHPMVPPHHWYSHSHSGGGEISNSQPDDPIGLEMQHLASFFPVASPTTTTTSTSTTDYSQNPASWDTLPGIGKGWSKHT